MMATRPLTSSSLNPVLNNSNALALSSSNLENYEECIEIKQIQIRKSGNEASPRFGFSIRGGKLEPIGISVLSVDENSVADLAGLKVNDIILCVNDIDFTKLKIDEAIKYILSQEVILVKVKRIALVQVSGTRMTSRTNSTIQMDDEMSGRSMRRVVIVRSNLRESFGFVINTLIKDNIVNTLYVTNVNTNSPASMSQLRVGDAIVEVNGKTIKSYQDFYDVLTVMKNATCLKLLVAEKGVKTKPDVEAILRQSFDKNENFSFKRLDLNSIDDSTLLKARRSLSLNNISQIVSETKSANKKSSSLSYSGNENGDEKIKPNYLKKLVAYKKKTKTSLANIHKKIFNGSENSKKNNRVSRSFNDLNFELTPRDIDILHQEKYKDFNFNNSNMSISNNENESTYSQATVSNKDESDSNQIKSAFKQYVKVQENTSDEIKSNKLITSNVDEENSGSRPSNKADYDQHLPFVKEILLNFDSVLNFESDPPASMSSAYLEKPSLKEPINNIDMARYHVVEQYEYSNIKEDRNGFKLNDTADVNKNAIAVLNDESSRQDNNDEAYEELDNEDTLNLKGPFSVRLRIGFANDNSNYCDSDSIKNELLSCFGEAGTNSTIDSIRPIINKMEMSKYSDKSNDASKTNDKKVKKKSIRFETYRSKSIPDNIQHTPDGLILIKIVRQPIWPSILGLKLSLATEGSTSKREYVMIEGFQVNGMAERLTHVFEIGMYIISVNQMNQDHFKSVEDMSTVIETIYKRGENLELMVKSNH